MRSDPNDFQLAAPASLQDVLRQLSDEPGKHAVIAGGTELMVALNTGRLASRSLLSLGNISGLRFIREEGEALHIGAGATFTDIRNSKLIQDGFPLLADSASWTGSVANQNRGTLGGNICNASPAADTPPALLVYDAVVTLISATGTREMPYRAFHLGYKRTCLQPDELLYSVTVPRLSSEYRQYIRKVGTRNAQAISKVALAAAARVEGGRIKDVRIGAASLADKPFRCVATERALLGQPVDASSIDTTVRGARAALASEAKPIDDIRSTAKYRVAVAGNLLEEFLRSF